MHDLPRLAITMGDPLGVGPEIIARAWSDESLHANCRPVVIGHVEIMRRAAACCPSAVEIVAVDAVDQVAPSPALLPCLNATSADALAAKLGTIDPRGGQAAYDALTCAAHLALAGQVDGLVTAPLQKAALWHAGHHYPGHTELLAELAGVDDFAMMLYLADAGRTGLGVVHVTLHMPLREVPAALSTEAILAKIHLADAALGRISGRRPRIGVCALNPHAGESGLFGDEEQTIIRPAVESAHKAGVDVDGPFPADSLMSLAYRGQFDGVVAMYHDQGHVALKLAGFASAVNVTLGLPIVRTSVAHGTAMDIAWQGRADHLGMIEAIRVAARLAASGSAPDGTTALARHDLLRS